MNKIRKISIVFLSMLLIFMTVQCCIVNAEPATVMSKITTLATGDADGNGAVDSTNKIAGAVISIAKVICAGVAIVMITVIAMKYMMAAPSEKADIKKHAVVYVVGAIVMFAATGILTIIQKFAGALE